MKSGQVFSFAWENMKQRKLRTTLTTLSVVIGIAAIIGLASLGEGFRVAIAERMQQGFELDVLTIIPGTLFAGFKPGMGFTEAEFQKINEIQNVSSATAIIQIGNVTLYKDDREVQAFVCTAVNFTEFYKVFPDRFVFKEGRLPESNENDTIVIGYKVNHNETIGDFASSGDNITMTVGIQEYFTYNYTLTVTGILQEKGTPGLTNFDYWVFIPINKIRQIYDELEKLPLPIMIDFKYHLIFVKVTDPDYSEDVAKEIEGKFKAYQITVLVPITFIRQVDNILNIVQTFLTAVASISLIVAGIGIMNIMTVSVMERTREIGIMKAIGAKDRTVLIMFLGEAMLIGLLGGLIGVPVGYGTANILSLIISRFSQQQTGNGVFQNPTSVQELGISPILSPYWVIGAIVFGVVICVLFGLYPARKAAKLDPVKALRYE